ncbi:dual specificity protein phosphatase family protein [bacterium]|nr:dual specificity protein phosphatase family protein [bacterium]
MLREEHVTDRATSVIHLPAKTAHPNNLIRLKFIHENLFLTSLYGAQTVTGDVSIIAVGREFTVSYLQNHNATYRGCVVISDTTDMSDDAFHVAFGKAAHLLYQQLQSGRQVCLHCHAGMNRSSCAALYYAYMYTDIDLKQAAEQMEDLNYQFRSIGTLTNNMFYDQLMKLNNNSKAVRQRHQRLQREFYDKPHWKNKFKIQSKRLRKSKRSKKTKKTKKTRRSRRSQQSH